MNLLPPLKLLEEWREAGLSPQEIYARCEEIDLKREIAACEGCQERPHARGMCNRHYMRLWMRERKHKETAPTPTWQEAERVWRQEKKRKLESKRLIIALHIRAGINSMAELNIALGKRPDNSVIWYHLDELRKQGIITWQGSRTITLTERGRAALANYCLLPGGGVGEIEKIGEAEGQIDG